MSPLLKAQVYAKAQRNWLVLVYVAIIVTVLLLLAVPAP